MVWCVCGVCVWCVCGVCCGVCCAVCGWQRDLNVFAREELSLKVIKVFKERAVSRQKPIHRGPYRLFSYRLTDAMFLLTTRPLSETKYDEQNPTPNCPIMEMSPPPLMASMKALVPDLALVPRWFTSSFFCQPMPEFSIVMVELVLSGMIEPNAAQVTLYAFACWLDLLL